MRTKTQINPGYMQNPYNTFCPLQSSHVQHNSNIVRLVQSGTIPSAAQPFDQIQTNVATLSNVVTNPLP
jgi:hypothetical protein